ncbi:unnamed protein product [Tetraodon nigroviridis]|uniref:(spotted green pufferfish) hypothetical protein n=1 Tax=Tetraodon nigroviridis TaxID=99883 RepID=Q4S0X9_TETNG|nr:unnamed protein product [Tetraodon nigroviridis]
MVERIWLQCLPWAAAYSLPRFFLQLELPVPDAAHFTTLCPHSPFSKRIMPREEDDKRLCLLLLTDLDDPTPAPHCSNRQRKMLT